MTVTQCSHTKLLSPTYDQQLHVIAIQRGKCSIAREPCITYEKETYVVAETFWRLDYTLSGTNDITRFTLHRNLLFTFHRTFLDHSLGLYRVLKVICPALYLTIFAYSIKQFPWHLHIIVDILRPSTQGEMQINCIQPVRVRLFLKAAMVLVALQRAAVWLARTLILNTQ